LRGKCVGGEGEEIAANGKRKMVEREDRAFEFGKQGIQEEGRKRTERRGGGGREERGGKAGEGMKQKGE